MVAFGTGTTLDVCSGDLNNELQCCSQAGEDTLGMTLNNAIRDNAPLDLDVQQTLTATTNLLQSLSSKYTVMRSTNYSEMC